MLPFREYLGEAHCLASRPVRYRPMPAARATRAHTFVSTLLSAALPAVHAFSTVPDPGCGTPPMFGSSCGTCAAAFVTNVPLANAQRQQNFNPADFSSGQPITLCTFCDGSRPDEGTELEGTPFTHSSSVAWNSAMDAEQPQLTTARIACFAGSPLTTQYWEAISPWENNILGCT